MNSQESRAAYTAVDEDNSAFDSCASLIFLEVLNEGCQEVAELAAKELLSVRVGAQRLLEALLVKVINFTSFVVLLSCTLTSLK